MTVKFNDGQLSVSIVTKLEIDHQSLTVRDDHSAVLAKILFTDLVIIEEIVDSLPGVISSKIDPNIRIEIDNADMFKKVSAKASQRNKSYYVHLSWTALSLLTVTVIAVFIFIIKFHSIAANLIATSIPQSWDDKIGHYAAEAMMHQSEICTNSAGQKAIEKLVGKLIEASGYKTNITLKVINDEDTINALAMSGNQIYVYSGLIKNAGNYEELAGVLAHEIGHLVKRHPTEGIIQQLSLNLIFKVISGGLGQLEYIFNTSNIFLILHYSRNHEIEADAIATQILTKAGIGTNGFLAFFKKLEEKEQDAAGNYRATVKHVEKFLSTHPLTEDRIQFITKQSADHPVTKKNVITKNEWKAIQNVCVKIKTS